jgi:hypothetical protein
VIAELELKRSPFELTRFESAEEITRDVAEQLTVDAVEQMFASTTAPPPEESPEPDPAPPAAPAIESVAGPLAVPQDVAIPRPDLLSVPEPTIAVSLPPVPEGPEMRWARWAGPQRMGETEEVNTSMFRGAQLPFMSGAPSPAFFMAADAAQAASFRARSSPAEDGTAVLPVIRLSELTDERRADELRAGGNARPSLSIEQYAALCAELAAYPGQVVHVHQRYGIVSDDARVALDEAFALRFSNDPSLQRRWQALVAHYTRWYQQQRL